MPTTPRTLTAIPVFPLPEFYLFPGTVMPLHVFETRYRQLIDDLMDGPGRLVTVPLIVDAPVGEFGPLLPRLGTLVEIMYHEVLPDGRWLVLVQALERVTIDEVPSDRLYRKVDAEVRPDSEVRPVTDSTQPVESDLRRRLTAALTVRAFGALKGLGEVSLGRLTDLLLHAMPLDAERKQRAYHEHDPAARAGLALSWHAIEAVE